MHVCTVCDTSLPQNSRFCPSCGTPVPGPGGTATVSDPASEQLERLRRVLTGRFEVLQELGRGGMASVYLARQVSLDRELAIKVLNPALNQDADLVQRFLREARTQGRLEHPGIIPVYEVYQEGGFNFYTMPRIQGPSLRLFLKENPKPPIETARRLLHEAADALGYAHRQGLIHRDVKPENMLMDAQRHRLILTDFGIAKTLSSVTMLTMTGEQLGTPRYMAPDQGDTKRPLDGRSDQYSLGLVAYEMLAGHMAVQADNLAELMYKHRYEEPEPLAALRPDAPAGLVAAIMRAISKNRDERFDSMEEFGAALLVDEAPAALADTQVTAGGPSPPTASTAPAAPAGVASAAGVPPAGASAAAPASPLTATSPPTPMSSGGVWRHDPVKGWTLEPALAEPLPVIPPASPGRRKKGGRPGLPPLFGGRGRRRSLWKWIGLGVAIVAVINGLGGRKSRRTTRASTVVVDESALPAEAPPGTGSDIAVPVPPRPATGQPDGAPPLPLDVSPRDWEAAVQVFAGLQAEMDSAFGGSAPAEVGRLAGLRARAESLAASGNFRGGAQLIREAGNDLRRLNRRAIQQKVALGVAAGNAARARAAAVSAGLDKSLEEGFAAADELRDAAVDAQEGGQLVEAEKKFRAAARAYAGLTRGADATPGGGASPGGATGPGAAAAPATPGATADPAVEIGAQLDRFGAAFATEDVAKIQGEFPDLALGRNEIGLFRAIFERTDNLSVARRATRISGEGDTRTADVDYVLSFKQARTQEAGNQPMRLRFRFKDAGGGRWTPRQMERR